MKSTQFVPFDISTSNDCMPPEMVEQLARAIVRDGGWALLIDAHNRGLRWVPIGEAAFRRPNCFAVEPAPDVLACDFDYRDGEDLASVLARDLDVSGLGAVIDASGRPGHTHVLSRIHHADLLQQFKVRARELGGYIPNAIRPPGAAHRLGLPVRLIHPTDPQEALRVLRALPRSAR